MPLPVEELLFGDAKRDSVNSDLDSALQVLKRRRLHGKQHAADHRGTANSDWEGLLARLSPGMRKGKVYYKEGDQVVQEIQKMLPQMEHVVVCKGNNRIQPLPHGCACRDAPLRYTVLVQRNQFLLWERRASQTVQPPRSIPRHGPGYLRLTEDQKKELCRLHNNLGHPNVEMFVKFLEERKAEPEIMQGARDYSCSVCLETVPTVKSSRPSKIHLDGDFGDVVGMDVAYWTNSAGKKFLFAHVVDEATLFQQAIATGRTPEEKFEVLADHWFQWAGPCQTLYVDPAGEYNSDFWRLHLQKAGVHTNVSAGEAHWQLARTEAHGKILKGMLTRMDASEPIRDDDEFRKALRAAVHAKSSLSRIKGFTPEQAVLGKMARLPGSLVADESATSHALADSDLPEGVAFQKYVENRRGWLLYKLTMITRTEEPCFGDHDRSAPNSNQEIGFCTCEGRRPEVEVRGAGGMSYFVLHQSNSGLHPCENGNPQKECP